MIFIERNSVEKTNSIATYDAMKRSCIAMFIFIFTNVGYAQDIQFSQFYASSMYANPAFAGSAHSGRVSSHTRYQWPRLDAKYFTTLASFDFYAPKVNSGFGIMALKDWQGSKNITTSEIHLLYSYEVPISQTFTCRLGLQGGYVSRNINYAVLNFPDQFNNNGPLDAATTEPFGLDRVTYFDVSSGAVLYSKKMWVSLAAHHMNTPNQSFYNKESLLPFKGSIAAGYKFSLNKDNGLSTPATSNYLVPSLHYKSQGKSDQFDVGIYYLYHSVIMGAWYRGLPGVKQYRNRLQNNESLALLFGWKNENLSIMYSYDFIVSKLGPALPGGAHELSIVYLFDFPKKTHKKYRPLPCPDFYKD